MSDEHDAAIRDRAYAIWEAEGSPEGRHDQHWHQAAAEVAEARDEAGQGGEPVLATPIEEPPAAAAPAAARPTPAKRPRKAVEATEAPAPAPKPRRKKGA